MKEIKTEQEFKDIIASEEPVVVKFFTTWCPDCVRMNNFIGDVMEEFNKFEWYSINKDEFQVSLKSIKSWVFQVYLYTKTVRS